MATARELLRLLAAGLLSGLLVLGLGGRGLMRLIAYATAATPRFTLAGTLQVVALGAVWGLLTAPLWLACRRRGRRWLAVLVFGLLTLGLALVGFSLLSLVAGPAVAPGRLRLLAALTFPVLFLVHAAAVDLLATPRGPMHPP